jgi:hypothetical protein
VISSHRCIQIDEEPKNKAATRKKAAKKQPKGKKAKKSKKASM